MHRPLGNPPWIDSVTEIAERIKPTICETYNSRGGQMIEGRILVDDFNTLMRLVGLRA